MSYRSRKREEEDPLNLDGCLIISEVKLLLDQKKADRTDTATESLTAVYKKTEDYVEMFSRFHNSEAIGACREILRKDPDLKQYEIAQLANLCPDEAEEGKSLIPSLKHKDEDLLQSMLNDISTLRNYQG